MRCTCRGRTEACTPDASTLRLADAVCLIQGLDLLSCHNAANTGRAKRDPAHAVRGGAWLC